MPVDFQHVMQQCAQKTTKTKTSTGASYDDGTISIIRVNLCKLQLLSLSNIPSVSVSSHMLWCSYKIKCLYISYTSNLVQRPCRLHLTVGLYSHIHTWGKQTSVSSYCLRHYSHSKMRAFFLFIFFNKQTRKEHKLTQLKKVHKTNKKPAKRKESRLFRMSIFGSVIKLC